MSAPAEKLDRPTASATQLHADSGSDRRADVDAKQQRVAALLEEWGCEGLLVLEPENFAWLTSGGAARAALDLGETPGLYFSADQRWALCGNVDSQRLFDEEIDGLGFQLKEWSWQRGREQFLADLCHGRRVACDVPLGEWKPVGPRLRRERRALSRYEQACMRSLGRIVSHALEATCRSMARRQNERETAGQLGHRLLHRGAYPLAICVAADRRGAAYRQAGFTTAPAEHSCVLAVTARKYGLCAAASRSVAFGVPDEAFRPENDAACKVSAAYIAATWPDAVPREILTAGRRVYQVSGFEHEWRHAPPGHVTGRAPVELRLTPQTEELLQAGWAVTWRASVGAALSSDTVLVTERGPELVTAPDSWPLKRIRFQGSDLFRPYPLERGADGAAEHPPA